MNDIQRTFNRLSGVEYLTVALPGTWSASDYLGDSTNDTGANVSGPCTLKEAKVNCQTSPDASSDLVVENETSGNTHTITVNGTYVSETGIDLHFSDSDEVSVYFSSVGATTAGADGEVVLEFEVDDHPV